MKYDHIVVGGGTAGCIVATRLSEDPERSVLLLEAGPDFPDFAQLPDMLKFGWGTVNLEARAAGSPYNWSFTGTATPEQGPMPVPPARPWAAPAPSTARPSFAARPKTTITWASWGNEGWSYLDCLPYFRKLENDADFHDDFHGTDGPVPVRHHPRETWPPSQEAFFQAASAAGYPFHPDVNHPRPPASACGPENNIDGVRMSMALSYIDSVRHRLNLTIRANVQANRVVLEGGRALGVEVESGGETFVVEGGEVILCAGAVASPQLLMLSGLGPADQLEAQGHSHSGGVARRGTEYARPPQRVSALPCEGWRSPRPQRHEGLAAAFYCLRFRHAQRHDTFSGVSEHRGSGQQPGPFRKLRTVPRGRQGRAAPRVRRPAHPAQHGLPLPGRGLGPRKAAGVRPALRIDAATQRLRQRHRGDKPPPRPPTWRPTRRWTAGCAATQHLLPHLSTCRWGRTATPWPSSTSSCASAASPTYA